MIDLSILSQNPELAKSIKLEVSTQDLIDFAEALKSKQHPTQKEPIPQRREKLLSRREACEMLGVSRGTLYRWNIQGVLKQKKIGKNIFYLKADIEKALGVSDE